jgi:16S rRNA (cytosine1402-N4)-methyltransferase
MSLAPIRSCASHVTSGMKLLHSCALAFTTVNPAQIRKSNGFNRRYFASSTLRKGSSDSDGDDVDFTASFATNYHAPVMAVECINALLGCQRAEKGESPLIFVDATLGGGGHSSAILERLSPGDVLFGCDVDIDALDAASSRLFRYMHHDGTKDPLFVPVKSNFCDLANVLPRVEHPITEQPIVWDGVDGVLMDLGVSSYQIDTAERGFAFMKDGPLDMRMGDGSLTAADICNEFVEEELKRILQVYGDEPRARKVAESIVQSRPLSTTQDLVKAVAAVTPEWHKNRRLGRTATLARVFQSLRIVVNREDVVLEKALLETCPKLIRQGGRLVVLSYHSMEDRATKRVLRDGTVQRLRQNVERDIYGNYSGAPLPWKQIGKGQKARDEEIELNTRARSAMLRVGERA